MVLVEYHPGKLLVRALVIIVGGLCLMGSLLGGLVGLFLIINGFRAVVRAMSSDRAAIIQHPRGLEVRTLWRSHSISFDHYTGVGSETLYNSIGIIPIPGPTMLVIESNRGGLFGKRKLRLPLGFLRMNKAGVSLLGEAIELYAMPHREAGAIWHKALEDREKSTDMRAPPRALARPNAAMDRRPDGRLGAVRRDPLEGAPRADLAGPAAARFGRKAPAQLTERL